MSGAIAGFATIAAVVALGYGLAAVRLVDAPALVTLSRLAFFVALPCLMLTVMATTPVSRLLSWYLVATAAGVAAAAVPYILIARLRWRRRADEIAIGAMSSAYTNAGNLGLPIAAYALGDAALIAPVLLLQLLLLQPMALAVLDAGRHGRTSLPGLARSIVTNPLTLATVAGVLLSLTGWSLPRYGQDPIALVGGMAVPSVLIAYGASLRLGPLPGRGAPPGELALITGLKLVVQPLGAYLAGWALGLDGPALLALAVTGALPGANNIFVLATRFGRGEVIARDAIFVTTIGTVPAILLITAVLA
jgi:malonate transporter